MCISNDNRKEWNLVVLTIVSSLNYEEGILSYLCRDGPSLKYRLYLCRGAPPTLAMCKTLRTKIFRAPRISWYSFGDICRSFKPSHLKNHEFHFFTKLPTKQSSYATVHRPTWPSANSIQFKTFVHQDFYSTHLGTFVGLSNAYISKTTNFIFSQNSPPSHLPMPWCTANLGHVQNPPN